MKTIIQNHQKQIRPNRKTLTQLFDQLFLRAHRSKTNPTALGQLTVHLMSDSQITEVNQAVFAKPWPTDVISLHYAPLPPDTQAEAELFINIEQAARQAPRIHWSIEKEFALYLAHGIDHLHGANDDTPAARQTMRRRELRWLRHPEITTLLPDLLSAESVHNRQLYPPSVH